MKQLVGNDNTIFGRPLHLIIQWCLMNSLVHRVGTNNIMLKMIMVIVMMCKFVKGTKAIRETFHKNTKVIMIFESLQTNACSLQKH